jgi:phosphatidylglycerophosphate synthase
MSALREWAALSGEAAQSAVAVSALGKWKTATQVCSRLPDTPCLQCAGTAHFLCLQMTSLGLLLSVRDGPGTAWAHTAGATGTVLLLVATSLTLLSLGQYCRALWPHLR